MAASATSNSVPSISATAAGEQRLNNVGSLVDLKNELDGGQFIICKTIINGTGEVAKVLVRMHDNEGLLGQVFVDDYALNERVASLRLRHFYDVSTDVILNSDKSDKIAQVVLATLNSKQNTKK